MENYEIDFSLLKPKGLEPQHAAIFEDSSVVSSYKFRPPYSPALAEFFRQLLPPKPRILDIGCGSGDLTVLWAGFSKEIVGVDRSANMISEAKSREGCNEVSWKVGSVEDVELEGQFDLISAAESLHWMDWEVVFPKMKRLLASHGWLAVIGRRYVKQAWWSQELTDVINKHSTNKDYTPYRLVNEIEGREYFKRSGLWESKPMPFAQSIKDLIEAFHSRNGLSRERMKDRGVQFDEEVESLLAPFADENGYLDLGTVSSVTWGRII